MGCMVTVRMFLAGILLKCKDHTLDYATLYRLFCAEFSLHTTKTYNPREVALDLVTNQEGWFQFKTHSKNGPNVFDVSCRVKLVSDLKILDTLRLRIEQVYWTCKGKVGRHITKFLYEAMCTLKEKTRPIRLPSFEEAFGHLRSNPQ